MDILIPIEIQLGDKALLAENGRVMNNGKVVFVSHLFDHLLKEFAFLRKGGERFLIDICFENLLNLSLIHI